jgi:hypothetical protein
LEGTKNKDSEKMIYERVEPRWDAWQNDMLTTRLAALTKANIDRESYGIWEATRNNVLGGLDQLSQALSPPELVFARPSMPQLQ